VRFFSFTAASLAFSNPSAKLPNTTAMELSSINLFISFSIYLNCSSGVFSGLLLKSIAALLPWPKGSN